MSNEAMREALTDDEIIAIRRWMPVIDPTDHSASWSETLKFARVIESCARIRRLADDATPTQHDERGA